MENPSLLSWKGAEWYRQHVSGGDREGNKMEVLLQPSIVVWRRPMGSLGGPAPCAGRRHFKRADQSRAWLAGVGTITATENKHHNCQCAVIHSATSRHLTSRSSRLTAYINDKYCVGGVSNCIVTKQSTICFELYRLLLELLFRFL